MSEPTIIIASLNDEQLKKSIQNMVDNFNTKLGEMVESADKKVQEINRKLAGIKYDVGGSTDGGASKQANAQKDATEATEKRIQKEKELNLTLDQQQTAIQKAVAPKSASDSYAAIIKNMRENVALLAMEIKSIPNISLDKQFTAYMQYERQIEQVRQRIAELRQQMQEMANDPNASRLVKKQTLEEIGALEQKIVQLEREQITATQQIANADKQILTEKQAQYEKEKQDLIALSAGQRDRVSFAREEVTAQGKVTEEIRKQAQAIRESQEFKKTGKYEISEKITEGGVEKVRSYFVEAKNALSIEEQLLENERMKARAQEISNENARAGVQEAKTEFEVQQQITKTVENRRKRYKTPDIGSDIDTRNIVATQLNVEKSAVINFDEQTSSLRQLSAALRQYQSAYERMSAEERRSPLGQQLLSDVQVLQRTIRQTRQEMSRPISLSGVLSQPARTLDEMSEKLRQLQSYKRGINLTDPKQGSELRQVDYEIKRLTTDMNKYMVQADGVMNKNNALTRSWNYMRNRLAYYLTVGATTQFVKSLVDVRGQYEMTERALGVLIGSAEYGTQIFKELSNMALVSPYTLIELSNAAKQLTAYGVAANEVVDTTRRMADMAAAVGVPMERLTYALGQVKAYGYLNSRDARMFANAGIPLVKDLAETYSELEGRIVSVADVYDRIKHKAVSYNDVMMSVQKMTDEGGRYFDFQAKMADTLKVQLANLTLAWNNMLNDMGKSNQGLISAPIKGLKELMAHWKEIERRINSLIILYGLYRTKNLILNTVIGSQVTSIKRQILADKQAEAQRLRKLAMTRKLTLEEEGLVKASNKVTIADYKQALSTKNLTTERAKLLIFFNRNNREMVIALQQMFNLTNAEVRAARGLKGLRLAWSAMGMAASAAGKMIKAAFASLWPWLLIGAIFEIANRFYDAKKAAEEFNDALRESGKNKFEEVGKFIKQYAEQLKTLSTPITKDVNGKSVIIGYENLSNKDAKNLWIELKEQITLSSSAADYFIKKLMSINDVNDRLRAGFSYLEDIQKASAAMQNLKDGTIKGEDSLAKAGQNSAALWTRANTTLDYLINKYGSLDAAQEDYTERLKKANNEYDRANIINLHYYDDYKQLLETAKKRTEEVRTETEKFSKSFVNFADNAGLGLNATIEALNQYYDQIAQKENKSLEDSTQERIVAEISVANKRIELIDEQIESEKQERINASNDTERDLIDKRISSLKKEREEWGKHLTGEQETFRGFTKWLTQYYGAEMRRMFGNKSNAELENLDWSKKENAEWAESLARKFAKEYGISFDTLWDYIRKTNDMSIFIKMTISTEDENSVYSALTKLDQDADTAYKTVKRLDERITQLQKKGVKHVPIGYVYATEDEKELTKAIAEKTKAQEDYNKAVAEGGHSRAEESNSRKGAADARKRQREGESELQKALKNELQLVDKVRNAYKDLTKAGMEHADALESATSGFSNSVAEINKTFKKYGLKDIDLKTYAGTSDPHNLLDLLETQLMQLKASKFLKTGELKDLEVKIQELRLDVKKYDLTKITDGLNNELGKIKEEYELAIELDANPELGDIFTNMFGIDKDALAHTIHDVVVAAQEAADKAIQQTAQISGTSIFSSFDVMRDDLDKWAKENNIEKNSSLYKSLQEAQNFARKTFVDGIKETEKILDDYVKKYGNYSDKIAELEADRINKIKGLNETYYSDEMRKAPEYIAKLNAIEQGMIREKGKIEFEEFKNSPYYVAMFENLEYATTASITAIREKLQGLKESFKELSPEQLKWVTQQMEKLDKELLSRNPFKGLTKNVKEYFNALKKGKTAQKEFETAQENYNRQKKIVSAWNLILKNKRAGIKLDKETISHIEDMAGLERDKLNEFVEERNIQDMNVDAIEEQVTAAEELLEVLQKILNVTSDTNQSYNSAKQIMGDQIVLLIKTIAQNLQSLSEFRDVLKDNFGIKLGEQADAVIDDMKVMGEGMSQAVNSIEHLDVFGTLAGVGKYVYGYVDAIASMFGDGAARTRRINKEIKKSEEVVRKLNMAYKDLERTVEKAMGAEEISARRRLIANKEAELAEVERQKRLEESKRKKDRDNDAIKQYEETAQDLRLEIEDLKDEVLTSLLGSDVKSAAEEFVNTWVEAWREGESTLDAINEKMDDMIYNLVKKAMANKIVGALLQPLYDEVDRMTSEGSEGGTELTINELRRLSRETGPIAEAINRSLGEFYGNLESLQIVSKDKNRELSALQQGIQSITEDTAGAIESYLNIMSQKVFEQNDVLIQIRDTIQGFDLDVQLGTLSEILLQLQASYQTQNAIRSIMEGWSSANGMSVRVEMV